MFREKVGRRRVTTYLHVAQLTELPRVEVCRPVSAVSALQARLGLDTDRTKLICTPIFLCALEQSKHIYTPNVTLAHVGFRALQSKQDLATSVI